MAMMIILLLIDKKDFTYFVENEDKYIVPGVGDAGDRIFGTK